MNEFESTAEAYRKARERSSVAAVFESRLLHAAVREGRRAGMSVRETAVEMGVSVSTVNSHWHEDKGCANAQTAWGTEEAWLQAYEDVWAHSPEMLANPRIPGEWREGEWLRKVGPGPVQAPETCAGGTCGHCEKCRSAQPV